MSVDVSIRSAEPRDVDAVLKLMSELAAHEGLSQFFVLSAEALHQFCFESPRRIELIVAERGEGIVGYATLLTQLSPWMGREYLFLDDLYVSEAARSSGIGLRLMKHVGALAVERGLDMRWHVEVGNEPAQKFYRALGAELREQLIAYWSIETIRKQLGSRIRSDGS